MSLSDQIRARIEDPIDVAVNGAPYVQAIRNVLVECEHIEDEGDEGASYANLFRHALAAGFRIEGGEQSE